MKKRYECPEAEILEFEEDVIAESPGDDEGGDDFCQTDGCVNQTPWT